MKKITLLFMSIVLFGVTTFSQVALADDELINVELQLFS